MHPENFEDRMEVMKGLSKAGSFDERLEILSQRILKIISAVSSIGLKNTSCVEIFLWKFEAASIFNEWAESVIELTIFFS